MKTIMLLLALCFYSALFPQSVSTGVHFNKSTQPALMLLLPYTEEIAEGTILKKLSETGYDPVMKGKLFWKQQKINGFYIFKGVVLKEVSGQPLDLYFKIEPRGRKNATSAIYLMVDKGHEKFVTPEEDTLIHAAARRFLNRFIDESAQYKLQKEIDGREQDIQEEEKKLMKLQASEKELQKKLQQLHEEISDNQSEQNKQQKHIHKEKETLNRLKQQASAKT